MNPYTNKTTSNLIGGGTIGSDRGTSVFHSEKILIYKPLFEVIGLANGPRD
jgi:hypothetical protein